MRTHIILLCFLKVIVIMLFPLVLYSQTALQEISQFNVPYGRFFMRGVQGNGDINGDGTNDIIFASGESRDPSSCLAHVSIYHSIPASANDTVPDQIIVGPNLPYCYGFGSSVCYSGDLNGDGCNDLVVSSSSSGELNSGYVHIYWGDDTLSLQPDLTLYGENYNNIDWFLHFGSTLLSDCDVNGDGYDDLIVYGYGPIPEYYGNVYVFLGGPQFSTTCALNISGTIVEEKLGIGLSTGDINGDGFDDIVLTRQPPFGSSTDFNYVLDIYPGGTNLSNVPAYEVTLGNSLTDVVYSILSNGDLNGDGYDDILVSYYNNGIYKLKIIYGLSNFDSLSVSEFSFPPSIRKDALFYCNLNNDTYSDFCVWQHLYSSDNRGSFTVYKQTSPMLDLSCDFINTGLFETSNFGSGFLLGDMNQDGYQEFFVHSNDGSYPPVDNYASILTEHYVSNEDDIIPLPTEKLLCYPNPFKDRINIKVTNKETKALYDISIFDVKGRIVYTHKDNKSDIISWNPDTDCKQKLSSGIYFVKIAENNKVIHTSKIIYTK